MTVSALQRAIVPVVVLDDERGAEPLADALMRGGNATRQPAVPVQTMDTVGAGDAFVAGYVSEYVAGHDVSTRVTVAVTAGAFACLTHGDWEGMPRRCELSSLHASEPLTR